MKYFTIAVFFLVAFSLKAQVDFKVSTLDSFITTTGGQGVYGLTAQEYNGSVHLAYYYGSEDEKWYLIHEVRRDGQQLFREEVQEFSGDVLVGGHTSMQFDANGNPFIYCSLVVAGRTTTIVFSRNNNEWSPVDLDYFAKNTYLHSSGEAGNNLGFVTFRTDFATNGNAEIIDYFSYESGAWTSGNVSTSDYLKTQPSAHHYNGDTYVSFIEAHPPDTTVLLIYKKTGNQWLLDYREVYPEGGYTFGGIAGYLLWQKFGHFNGEIHLIHNMDKSKTGALTHIVYSNGSWRAVDFTNREDIVDNPFAGSELEFDSKGNMYWASGTDQIIGINTEQEYFEFEGPFDGNYWACLDFEILNDDLYLYHIAGDKNFPYGDPVMFYESIGTLGTSSQQGDECEDAIDIQSLLGSQAGEVNTSGVYDNTGYNSSSLLGECLAIQNSIWFSFTGNDGSYNFTSVQCGVDLNEYIDDSQVHIYSGDCNNLVFEDCNDDGATLAFDLDLETEQGKQYYLIVDGFDFTYEGKFCLQVTETSTSSKETLLQNINIYPNPALDRITIEGFEGDRLELIDLTGKVIRSWTGDQQQLQLHGLPSGSYFLRMYNEEDSILRKIIKQ